jgi:general secretion pathway protein G
MLKRIAKTQRGFTLIELMIVVSIIGILAAIAAPNYQWGIVRAREAVLREELYMIRSAIDQYTADQLKPPVALQDLVDNKNKYLKEIPMDPITRTREWTPVMAPPPEGQQDVGERLVDVHSTSPRVGSNDVPYAEW